MNPDKLIRSFSRSFEESHDYKPTRECVRSPLFGRLLAGWIFIWRATSAFQFIKTLYKTGVYYSDGDQEQVHPVLAELYLAATFALLGILPLTMSEATMWNYAVILLFLASWKAFETLSASLYYHAFRDFFEIKDRISSQRSFLLSIADLAVICLCVSWARILLHGATDPALRLGDVDFFASAFAGPKGLHFDLLLSVFVWLQVTVTLTQGIGFLNARK